MLIRPRRMLAMPSPTQGPVIQSEGKEKLTPPAPPPLATFANMRKMPVESKHHSLSACVVGCLQKSGAPHLACSSTFSSLSPSNRLAGHVGNCCVEDEDSQVVVVPPSIKRKWVRTSPASRWG